MTKGREPGRRAEIHARGRRDSRQARGELDGAAIGQQRAHIAQVAARLIAEHGITDWTLAKRKAAHQLMLGDGASMPGDDEIQDALVDFHALFGGAAHAEALRRKRGEALLWMRRFGQFAPVLTGGVAAGWATEHSDIRLELVAADAKSVELVLLGAGENYRTMPADRDGATELWLETPHGGMRLSVRTPEHARQRSQRDRHGRPVTRLNETDLAALLTPPVP